MIYFYFYDTALGRMGIAEEDGSITNLFLRYPFFKEEVMEQETPVLQKAYQQITEYMEGKRKKFDVPIEPKGTEFQKKVWKMLMEIPYGETCSYGEIAKRIGSPKGARAVGMANHHNPIMIIVPCHRVVGAKGQMVGYALGIDCKIALLNLEKGKGKNLFHESEEK